MERRRSVQYAMLTAAAAALGLLLLRAAFSTAPSLALEFLTNRLTYLYVFAVTAVLFLALGYVLGRRIDELKRLSTTDPLTGLANRRAFQARLRDEWRRTRRYTPPLSLLMIDIDGLKRINDECGHVVGDQVLRTAAHAISTTMRVTDFAARWGGDEFAVVAPNTDRRAAYQLAQRLLAGVADDAKAREAGATASIGVATLEPVTNPSATVEWLLETADSALYQAKNQGRNRVNVG